MIGLCYRLSLHPELLADTHRSRLQPPGSFKARAGCIALLHKSVSRGLEDTQRRRTTFSSRSSLAAFVAPCAARRTPSILPVSSLVLSPARPTPVSLERNSLPLQRILRNPRSTSLVTLSSLPATTSCLIPPVTVPRPRLLLSLPRITSRLPSANPR